MVYTRQPVEQFIHSLYNMASTSRSKNRDNSGTQEDRLPSPDAIQNILPDYKYIFHDPSRPSNKKKAPEPVNDEEMPNSEPIAGPSHTPQDRSEVMRASLEQNQMTMLDHQMKEIENYRQAVHRMGKDILTLRDHIHELEDNNAALRRQLNKYDDTRKLLLDQTDMDSIDKNDLIIRYMTLKQKLQSQVNDVAAYREKAQTLQNQLMRKNEHDKKYTELKQAHMTQGQHLRNLQERVGKVKQLEEACKSQEKVIEKMEKILRGKSGQNSEKDTLVAENKRLRNEIDNIRRGDADGETEKARLYQQLERAENRVSTLEKTLTDNSRAWGRERTDMQIKLNEADHGFTRTQGMVLHDYPKPGVYQRQNRSLDLPYAKKRYGSPRLDPIQHW